MGRLLEVPKTLRYANSTAPEPRLHIISVTGLKNIAVAIGMQRACKRRMGSGDSYANICDVGCANKSQGALDHVVEMGDAWSSAPLPSDPYERAAVKYSFGLVQEVERLWRREGPLPRWWLIKDYDTYIDVDRLMAWVEPRASPEDLVSYGQLFSRADEYEGQDQFAGGWGWLLSRAMARRLGLDLRAEVLAFAAAGCGGTACFFDGGSRGTHPARGLPWLALERIPGARLEGSAAFAEDPPCAGASMHLKSGLESYQREQLRAAEWTVKDAEAALPQIMRQGGC